LNSLQFVLKVYLDLEPFGSEVHMEKNVGVFIKNVNFSSTDKDMDILDDMGVSKLSEKSFLKSELLL